MEYTINQLYKKVFQNIFDVYDVFSNFFGEEYVDLQIANPHTKKSAIYTILQDNNIVLPEFKDSLDTLIEVPASVISQIKRHFADTKAKIYVYWPKVTITNENDRSVEIEDLYALIEINTSGQIPYENTGFLLNRATYSELQFNSDFMHSHIQSIPKNNFTTFMKPCLGRGPIQDTIDTLKSSNDETMWMLFCQELSMYVTVESLKGIPWKKLEELGKASVLSKYSYYSKVSHDFLQTHKSVVPLQVYSDFTKYYLEHGHLSLSFKDGIFFPGMSCPEFIIDVSNCFIDYYNQHLKDSISIASLYADLIINKVLIKEGKFYRHKDFQSENISRYQGAFILTFKDKPVHLNVHKNNTSTEDNASIILHYNIAMSILHNILNIINYRYVNQYNINTHRLFEPITTIGEKVLYL